MAEEVGTNEVDYKAEYEKLQADHAKLKQSFDKTASEVSNYKKQLAERQTDEEKREAELLAREQHYKELERKNTISEYKEHLADSVTDKKTLENLATLFADGKITEAIKLQNDLWEARKAELTKQIQSDLMQKNAVPPPATGAVSQTKADIMAIKDPRERQAAIANNLNLFQ